MNIIIPLGGKGERFSKDGFTSPKPLIQIFEKCMIDYVIDNLYISDKDHVFIIYNANLDNYQFSTYIHERYPFIQLINICDTKGAAETLFLGIEKIIGNYKYNEKCLILDCDTFYTQDIRNIFNKTNNNIVFYTKNTEENPIYSYIMLDDECIIIDIKEKLKISDNANTGAYAFTDINVLQEYCQHILDNNITFNNEPYTSCVISEMINNKIKFIGYELNENHVFSLGTPNAVKKYIDDTYAFLFDLDGTIVITDDIYFDVWYKILLKYNIVLTTQIFKTFIQGNNDKYVLNTLISNIDLQLSELSAIKDDLFIKSISKIKTTDGIYNLLNEIRVAGHKICIVTNCNRKVVNEIVKYIDIEKYIDFIITSEDCIIGKPDPEPYMKAINKYNISNNKSIIFEDSKTGILSGKSITPKLLVGIETIYNSDELSNIGVNLSIKNFTNLSIYDLIKTSTDITYCIKTLIKNNTNVVNIKDIIVDETKLKGGFIADVIAFKIITEEGFIYSQILKYENREINNLSYMAKSLKLYDREYYFYTNIAPYVNVNIPKFYNLVLDENFNRNGLVLENLIDKNYRVNLNLNNESIDITLSIIDRTAKLHTKFWNKNLKKMFPELKNSTDNIFYPFFNNFITERYEMFKDRWFHMFPLKHQVICHEIYTNFTKIQERFSTGNNLTFIHGDIKSPNIFYDVANNFEPYFIDWQHCAIGKGVQDVIFFILESFNVENIKTTYNIVKYYYYKKIVEYGVINYSLEDYEKDIYDAICYIPFFTSIWFGTTPHDELIDKNFPYFFISKMFYLIELIKE
jgi:HAD superfamily hydrolase (TIGR01509 family)